MLPKTIISVHKPELKSKFVLDKQALLSNSGCVSKENKDKKRQISPSMYDCLIPIHLLLELPPPPSVLCITAIYLIG